MEADIIVWAIKSRRGYLGAPSFAFGSQGARERPQSEGLQRVRPAVVQVSHHVRLHTRVPQGYRQRKCRFPEPATKHDHSGSNSLTPVDDGGIVLIRACGLRTRSSPTPGVGLGGLVPCPHSAVLGGLPFGCSDFRDFYAHGQRKKIHALSAPFGRFVACFSAAVTTVDFRPGRGERARRRHRFRFVFSRTLWGRHGLCRSPDVCRSACSFTHESSQGADSAANTDPAASAPSPPGNPASPTGLLPTGRILTRTRRWLASANGTTSPAVDYGFGPDVAPHPPAWCTNNPLRVPRPRPPLAVVTAPSPAASLVPTVPIPSERDRTEPVGTPFLRLPLPPGVPSATTADLDALHATA